MHKWRLGFGLGIVSAIFWGTNGIFCALLSDFGLSTVNIALLAPIFNFICFFLLLMFTNRRGFTLGLKSFFFLVLNGMGAGLVNISFVKSVSYFPVGIVSTLVFCNVFVLIIISRIVFKTPITVNKIISAAAAVFGVGLVLDVFSGGIHLNFTGLFWILMIIMAWSSMVTVEKYLLEKGMDGTAIMMYTSLFAILTLSVSSPPWDMAGNIIEASRDSNGLALLAILGYGLIPQAACYFLYITGLKYIDPGFLQITYSLDPVTASILGFLVFGQTLNMSQVIGILIILIVIGYLQVKENRKRAADNENLECPRSVI